MNHKDIQSNKKESSKSKNQEEKILNPIETEQPETVNTRDSKRDSKKRVERITNHKKWL
jgi:hypothetical protein